MSGTWEDWLKEHVVAAPKVEGGPWFVRLDGIDDQEEVFVGPYENPALAKELAQKLRAYLAALPALAVH